MENVMLLVRKRQHEVVIARRGRWMPLARLYFRPSSLIIRGRYIGTSGISLNKTLS